MVIFTAKSQAFPLIYDLDSSYYLPKGYYAIWIMKIQLTPGPGVDFRPCIIDVSPSNTISEMVSLLSLRYTHLDPVYLCAAQNDVVLKDDLTVIEAGVKDEDKVEIRLLSRRNCCQLL